MLMIDLKFYFLWRFFLSIVALNGMQFRNPSQYMHIKSLLWHNNRALHGYRNVWSSLSPLQPKIVYWQSQLMRSSTLFMGTFCCIHLRNVLLLHPYIHALRWGYFLLKFHPSQRRLYSSDFIIAHTSTTAYVQTHIMKVYACIKGILDK